MWTLILSYLFFRHSVFATPQQKIESVDGRIIGGHEVTISEFPYQVSVEYQGAHICGGAIIGRSWVITAAHCFDGRSIYASIYSVRAGTSYRNIGGQVKDVLYFETNSYYSNATRDYDIALMRLRDPISLSSDAKIVGLPETLPQNIEGAVGKVTGWGSTTAAGSPTSVLRAVDVPIMVQTLCSELYPDLITARMFCAGIINGGYSACTGDDGGPLVVNSVLTGIVSWWKLCAEPQQPGVYTNILSVRDWITQITGI